MLFRQVIGQNPAKQLLRQMIAGDRLPHALLFLGAGGSGQLALALATARYLLCENRQAEDACGQCPACNKLHKFIHPDLHFSFPTVGSKMTSDSFLPAWRDALAHNPYLAANDWLQRIGAENKQGNITKDECVSIIHKLSLKSFEADYKVLLMWLPEYLGNEGNRLLKLIEEPPDRTVFLLVAENQDLILNTILSRCQLVKLSPLGDEEMAEALRERFDLDAETALGLAQLANGDYNEAQAMAGRESHDHATPFLDWMRRCYKGQPTELVQWTDTFAEWGRENQKEFLRYALHFWREFLLLRAGAASVVRLRPAERETAQRMTSLLDFEDLEAIVGLTTDSIHHIERNAHPKVLMLNASIRLHRILQHRDGKRPAPTEARSRSAPTKTN